MKNHIFLASAIIINFTDSEGEWHSYLFSSVVAVPKLHNSPRYGSFPLMNYYVHAFKVFTRKFVDPDGNAHEFEITGTFFCEQNGYTSFCAHASSCMVINNLNLPNGQSITPQEINNFLKIDFNKMRTKKNKGLLIEDIVRVMIQFAPQHYFIDFFHRPSIDYEALIYHYIESGYPVLLTLTTDSTKDLHAVTVVGHRLDSDVETRSGISICR